VISDNSKNEWKRNGNRSGLLTADQLGSRFQSIFSYLDADAQHNKGNARNQSARLSRTDRVMVASY